MNRPGLLVPARPLGRWLMGVAVVVVLLASVLSVVIPRLVALPADAAFEVRGTVVSKQELQRRVELLGSLYGIRPPPDGPARETFRRDSAKAIAVSTILDQAAAERGIVISDKVARDGLAKSVQDRMGPQGQDGYVRLLAESGASEDDALQEMKRQQSTQQLFTQVAAGSAAGVSDADVRTYFRDHPAEMTVPEQRHLRNIVVASEPEARAVLDQLRAGADFGGVARQNTLDESTRASGGDLGLAAREQLDPAFGATAFGSAANALFGPVKTKNGWNVGQVLEIQPGAPLPFEQVVQPLTERLRSDRATATWRGWMAQEIARADVRYADEFRPADPGAPAAP